MLNGTVTRLCLVGSLVLGIAACASPTASAPAAPASGAAAPASSSSDTGLTKITVPYAVLTISNVPVWGAYEAGIFQKHGLDVNLLYVDNPEVASLMSGSAQIAQGGGPEVVSADANGADVVFIASMSSVYSYVLEARPEIQSLNDLRGKKIGSSAPGSLTDVALHHVLAANGIDPDKDVDIINMASPQARTPALLNGEIDATMDSPPNSYVEEAQGFHAIYDLAAQKVPTVSNGITVRRDYMQAHPQIVQAYIDSIFEGIAKVKTDPQFGATVLEKYMKVDPQYALPAAQWAGTYLIADPPTTTIANFSDIIAGLGQQNPNLIGFDMTKYVDNSFVESAITRGVGRSAA